MNGMNPFQLIGMMKNGNPQQVAMSLLNNNKNLPLQRQTDKWFGVAILFIYESQSVTSCKKMELPHDERDIYVGARLFHST